MIQNNEREKLDVRYFNEKLRLVLEGLPNYTRSELARELQRLSNTASPISKEWVVLSSDEVSNLWNNATRHNELVSYPEFARLIESRLKQLNAPENKD